MTFNNQILNWFEYFHKHPEVSFKEVGTTQRITEILDDLHIKHRRFEDMTGVIAEVGEGCEVIAVRADIDALWQEVDGVYQANHSCGHDAHISMVLGALLYLQDKPLRKKIRFIFQPAEERGNGSLEMIARGAMENVTHLFGIHLRPAEELPLGQAAPSIHHGAGVMLEGKIVGTDAHGARPHQGKNAIDAVVALHGFIKSIYVSPFEPHSVKLTKIHAGGESLNIIPGTAEFGLDLRAQKNEVLTNLQSRIEEGIKSLESLHGLQITWEWRDHTPGAEVSREAEIIAAEAIGVVLGEENTAQPVITSGSDDFHFYTIKHPEVKATMIGLGADLKPGLHHPNMTFNHSVLDQGAKILAQSLSKA
ncbi:amidohydrolase [Cytobacillus purgationiresistens]|uniref:Amidohydrolase n=1 Tax=Cytobacillus purgationiresistens TaxID=863449 RepID=A0ABU0APZ4_9BACI|nr:amidohydrolase [Cytobacillus purgationiresistens]MDQ0272826.1 amidohydrolase [Cytobacillus purgationiresistens]